MDDLGRLRVAVMSGDLITVTRLLDGGCDPNAWDAEVAFTPLLLAIEHSQAGVAALLVARGADPNLAGHQGVTPLQAAVDVAIEEAKGDQSQTEASIELVDILLAAGANPLKLDDAGRSALDWADDMGHGTAAQKMRNQLSTVSSRRDPA